MDKVQLTSAATRETYHKIQSDDNLLRGCFQIIRHHAVADEIETNAEIADLVTDAIKDGIKDQFTLTALQNMLNTVAWYEIGALLRSIYVERVNAIDGFVPHVQVGKNPALVLAPSQELDPRIGPNDDYYSAEFAQFDSRGGIDIARDHTGSYENNRSIDFGMSRPQILAVIAWYADHFSGMDGITITIEGYTLAR